MDKIPGMLFYQIIDKSAHERRVITWWKSREPFVEAWKRQFPQLLGAHGALCFEGFQLAHRAKRDLVSWITPGKIATMVAALAVFLTSLSTIENWGYSLLALPDCTLWTDPEAASKPKAAGESFPIQIQVKNRHLRASSTATIKASITKVSGGDRLKLADEKDSYSVRIEPGKAEVADFRFEIPDKGQYVISFDGTQKGGYVFPSRNIPQLTQKIDVWDSIDHSPQVSLVKYNDFIAFVSVEVHNAKPTPYGMELEATLGKPDKVDIRPDKLSIKDAEDPLENADFAVLRWRLPPSNDILKPQTFRLVLHEASTKGRTRDEWNQLLTRLTVQADEPGE
jgi:hypothetical protein